MDPFVVEVLVRERQQRFAEEAARYRRLQRNRPRRRPQLRLVIAGALISAGRRLAGCQDWSPRPVPSGWSRS